MKKVLSIVLCLIMALSVASAVYANGVNFADVNSGSWYYEDVMNAVEMGIINGKSTTEFAPDEYLTYAEAIKLAACMYQIHKEGEVLIVPGEESWYEAYVNYCESVGIITKDYNYNDYATRAGYMEIFANALPAEALEEINDVPLGSIPDVPVYESYCESIYKLYRAGIIQGVDAAGRCEPNSNIKRCEVAAIITRMMDESKRLRFDMTHKQEDTASFLSVKLGDKYLEEWNENYVIQRVSWNKLTLSEEDAKNFPKLKKALDEVNNASVAAAEVTMDALLDASQYFKGDEYNPMYLFSDSKIFVQRADSCLLSYLEELNYYTGGVHSNYAYIGVNYDPETGKELSLTDVLTNTEKLPTILQKKLTAKYNDIELSNNQAQAIMEGYSPENYQWTMDYQGITFWFSPYELASFAAGTLTAKIYFDEEPGLFEEKFRVAPSENYVLSLPKFIKMDFDLVPDDGKRDVITIDESLDDYGSYNMLSVTVNGNRETDEINSAYSFDVYLVHMGKDNYIYSDSYSDNDYHMFCTWDINGNKPKQTSELFGTELDYEYIEEGFEDGTVYRYVLNDPGTFKLETRFEILGTRGATANYKVSEKDGTPEMTDEAYTFNYGHDVTSGIALEAKVLPDMKKEVFAAGTSFTPYQTDGKSYVDLKTKDGRIVRLEIDISKWPRTVNEIPEDECFENLMYAG